MHTCLDDPTLTHLLQAARSIAIIGAKDTPTQAVNMVGTYLIEQGYTLIPVHPVRKIVWGIPAFASIADITFPVDLVLVFRAPEYCLGHAREFLTMPYLPKTFWMQKGIQSPEATTILEEKNIIVVQDLCIKIEHERLAIPPIAQAFDCKQCGLCCLGKGGIALTPHDIDRLALALHITKETFLERYTEMRQEKPSIITNAKNACIFFTEEEQCLVHEDKPDVCRAWPFFAGNMCDTTSLAMAKEFCPGIDPAITHEAFIEAGNRTLHAKHITRSTNATHPNALKPTP